MESKINVLLVNLISEDYLTRYQAPLAVNVLASYFRSVCPEIAIASIDMQDVFKKLSLDEGSVSEVFKKTLDTVANEIVSRSFSGKTIVGLSVKWGTQEIAGRIIEKARKALVESSPLFVIGNIGSTHGYKELLMQDSFSGIIAVVGEGEAALVRIARMAEQNIKDYVNLEHYKDIVNVAVNLDGVINVSKLERVDLRDYPPLINVNPSEIYDQEWDVYAIETSRGCPWGNCTFCSIKKQFGTFDRPEEPALDWRWRPFEMDKVLSDIYRFAKQGVRRFDIKDSEFFGPVHSAKLFSETMDRVNEFAYGLIALNEELRSFENLVPNNTVSITHISARIDTIYSANPSEEKRNALRRKAYSLLKAAGLRRVYLGIESGSASQLKRYCKGISVEENKRAIEILRELGLEIEVGFIFFDYLCTLEELRQNIIFIEETNIHDTDSRILGSLRIQKGSPYENLARRMGIIGEEYRGQLSFEATFVNKEVAEIEALFSKWEKSTRKLSKIIPSHLRIENYRLDFDFLKDVVSCYEAERKDWLFTIVEEHSFTRSDFFGRIKQAFDDGLFGRKISKLFLEYFEQACTMNKFLTKEVSLARYDGSY